MNERKRKWPLRAQHRYPGESKAARAKTLFAVLFLFAGHGLAALQPVGPGCGLPSWPGGHEFLRKRLPETEIQLSPSRGPLGIYLMSGETKRVRQRGSVFLIKLDRSEWH
ncbi:hypothetical protein DdX_12986 [Ditylenchus destructor]|uniref:Uncharacterized protein n=1 Tax=Ditylenchus destructor TaxID=166010 RepID=A0AAD4R314_9BILA|nr:hypothetical protein DdX_12986 [Ditylenchus destructor]